MIGEDPSVLSWRLTLAPRPREAPRRHWWREHLVDEWRAAHHAWWLAREAACNGHATEQREWEADHPPPRLGDYMTHLRQRDPGRDVTCSCGLWHSVGTECPYGGVVVER